MGDRVGYRSVSRPGELHPQPLVERYVSLSTHTAPIRRTTCRLTHGCVFIRISSWTVQLDTDKTTRRRKVRLMGRGPVSAGLPWCTTRDLGQSLPSTPRSEVPHDECHAPPAEVRPDGLPCPELAGVRDGSPRARESDRLARTHRWHARPLALAEADNASTRTTPSRRRSPWAWCVAWRPGRLRASCARG